MGYGPPCWICFGQVVSPLCHDPGALPVGYGDKVTVGSLQELLYVLDYTPKLPHGVMPG